MTDSAHLDKVAEAIWRAVVGFESRYEVSDHGQVRSLDHTSVNRYGPYVRKGKVLRPATDKDGYLIATLGKRSQRKVHRLVLTAFVGLPKDGQVVRHLNGDKADNRLANLRWGTVSENNMDTARHGTHHCSVKAQCPQGHDYTPENVIIVNRKRSPFRRCRTCWNEYQRAFARRKYHARKAAVGG